MGSVFQHKVVIECAKSAIFAVGITIIGYDKDIFENITGNHIDIHDCGMWQQGIQSSVRRGYDS